MKSRNKTIVASCAFFACLLLAAPMFAQQQTLVTVHQAKLSIPFGEVNGYLVQVDDYLVFIDQDQQQNSFAVRRSDVRNMNAQDDTINVDLNQPVRGRNGQNLDRLAFRVDKADMAGLTSWGSGAMTGQRAENTQPTTGITNTSNSGSNAGAIIATYQAKHKHTFGECRGNLIIKDNGIGYESIDDINHSRQWAFRDIRELHRDNPYKLSVDPFSGDHYDLEFLGKGMDNNVFQSLVQRVTSARVAE